jgi:hypothetical protein
MLGFRRIVITTPLEVSDVCAAIGAETRAGIPLRPTKGFFQGRVSGNGFELRRSGPFKNGIGPVIAGTVSTADDGTTTIKATLRMSLFGLVLLASLATIGAACLIVGARGGFVAVFVMSLTIAAYEADAGRCETQLRSALNAV